MDNMEAMGAEAPEQEMEGGEEGGYAILINVDPQGQISVSSGPYTPEAEGEPASTIKEALTMALTLHRSNGKADPKADEQAGFDSAVNQPESDPGDHEYRG